jgi:hypothetical protein
MIFKTNEKFTINKVNNIYNILIIFCLFPFIEIFKFGTDAQPNALIIASGIFILNANFKFPKLYLLHFIIAIVSFIVLLNSKFDKSSFLSFSNYFSFLIVPFSVYVVLKKSNGLSYNLFKISVNIWLYVGLVQFFFYKSFLTFILSRSTGISLDSTFNRRGVVSLAPEPTYYGSIILLFLIIYLINFYDKKDYKLLFSLFIQLFILSQSSTSIIVLITSLIIFFLFFIFKLKLKSFLYIFTILFIILIIVFFLTPLYSHTRFYSIAQILISNPKLIFLDQSISERFNAIYFTIQSLMDNFGIPNGYNTYQNYILLKSNIPDLRIYFLNFKIENYSRILSGYGMGFFELGLFGLLIPITIFFSLKNYLKLTPFFFAFILFNFILFTAMSLNNATILFIIGNMLYLNSKSLGNNQQKI